MAYRRTSSHVQNWEYVVLSRVRTQTGLYLIEPINIMDKSFIHLQNLKQLNRYKGSGGNKNSCPVGFYSRNSTKSTVNLNTTIHKHYHHGGAVRPSFGVGSMDPPDRMRRPSSKGVRRGGG